MSSKVLLSREQQQWRQSGDRVGTEWGQSRDRLETRWGLLETVPRQISLIWGHLETLETSQVLLRVVSVCLKRQLGTIEPYLET